MFFFVRIVRMVTSPYKKPIFFFLSILVLIFILCVVLFFVDRPHTFSFSFPINFSVHFSSKFLLSTYYFSSLYIYNISLLSINITIHDTVNIFSLPSFLYLLLSTYACTITFSLQSITIP